MYNKLYKILKQSNMDTGLTRDFWSLGYRNFIAADDRVAKNTFITDFNRVNKLLYTFCPLLYVSLMDSQSFFLLLTVNEID